MRLALLAPLLPWVGDADAGADGHVFSCVSHWWKHCFGVGANLHDRVCSESEWAGSPLHCLRRTAGDPVKICQVSGARIPAAGGRWGPVLDQYTKCIGGLWDATYAEVRWDPRHFSEQVAWARGADLPPAFGLCFFKSQCSESMVERFLVPMYWMSVLRRDHLLSLALEDGFDFFVEVKRLMPREGAEDAGGEVPGNPRLLHGSAHLQAVYGRAMQERAALVEPRGDTTAAACIVGMPWSFARAEVHGPMHRMIRGLGLAEVQHVYVMQLERPSARNTDAKYAYEAGNASTLPALRSLMEPFSLMHPHVLVTVPVRREGHPPHRRCNASWAATEMACNAQWRSLELCMSSVRMLEARRGRPFDWVLRLRPDTVFNSSLGDIRAYDPSRVHVRKSPITDAWDGFALIPRRHADAYFAARQSAAAEFCWVSSRGRPVLSGECEHRLTKHLMRRRVPLGHVPKGLFFTVHQRNAKLAPA